MPARSGPRWPSGPAWAAFPSCSPPSLGRMPSAREGMSSQRKATGLQILHPVHRNSVSPPCRPWLQSLSATGRARRRWPSAFFCHGRRNGPPPHGRRRPRCPPASPGPCSGQAFSMIPAPQDCRCPPIARSRRHGRSPGCKPQSSSAAC